MSDDAGNIATEYLGVEDVGRVALAVWSCENRTELRRSCENGTELRRGVSARLVMSLRRSSVESTDSSDDDSL